MISHTTKIKIEKKINAIGINNFSDKILSDKDRKDYSEIASSEARERQTPLPEYRFTFSFGEGTINNFQKIFDEIEKLLSKEVVSETLNRLKDDQSLNNWVKQGFDLYKTKKGKDKCLFCEKPLDSNFLSTLSKHFSKDYEELLSAITNFKK